MQIAHKLVLDDKDVPADGSIFAGSNIVEGLYGWYTVAMFAHSHAAVMQSASCWWWQKDFPLYLNNVILLRVNIFKEQTGDIYGGRCSVGVNIVKVFCDFSAVCGKFM